MADVLPYALGVALSPVPLLAVTVLLLSALARETSLGFLVGWTAGVTLAVVVATAAAGAVVAGAVPGHVTGTVLVSLGAVLLVLAAWQWRARPRPGEPRRTPAWLLAADTLPAPGAAMLGVLLSAANPKNLALAVGAGTAIVGAGGGATAAALGGYVLVAVSTVAVPVLAFRARSSTWQRPLGAVRRWLERHHTVVVLVVLVAAGALLVLQGLRQI